MELYEHDYDGINEFIKAKALLGSIKKIKRNIKIDSPWGTTQYLRKDDVLIKKCNGETYGISKYDFNSNYDITNKTNE